MKNRIQWNKLIKGEKIDPGRKHKNGLLINGRKFRIVGLVGASQDESRGRVCL
jgi:hypothetical protein